MRYIPHNLAKISTCGYNISIWYKVYLWSILRSLNSYIMAFGCHFSILLLGSRIIAEIQCWRCLQVIWDQLKIKSNFRFATLWFVRLWFLNSVNFWLKKKSIRKCLQIDSIKSKIKHWLYSISYFDDKMISW